MFIVVICVASKLHVLYTALAKPGRVCSFRWRVAMGDCSAWHSGRVTYARSLGLHCVSVFRPVRSQGQFAGRSTVAVYLTVTVAGPVTGRSTVAGRRASRRALAFQHVPFRSLSHKHQHAAELSSISRITAGNAHVSNHATPPRSRSSRKPVHSGSSIALVLPRIGVLGCGLPDAGLRSRPARLCV
jgi:hypothetical protein